MTEPLIQWNKLKTDERKRMTKQQVKDSLSIVSAGRFTLYRIYYCKIESLFEMTLLDFIAQSFKTNKTFARSSGPKSYLHRLAGNPHPLGTSLASLISLAKAHSYDNHHDEAEDEQEDNMDHPAPSTKPPHPSAPLISPRAPPSTSRPTFFSENRLTAAISQVQGLKASSGESILASMVHPALPAILPPGPTLISGSDTAVS